MCRGEYLAIIAYVWRKRDYGRRGKMRQSVRMCVAGNIGRKLRTRGEREIMVAGGNASGLGSLTGIAYCEEGENTVYVYIVCNGLEDRREGGGVCMC